MGLDAATEALRWGVNDLGGTLMEESISRLAGSYHGVKLDPEDLIARRPPRRPPGGRAHDALRASAAATRSSRPRPRWRARSSSAGGWRRASWTRRRSARRRWRAPRAAGRAFTQLTAERARAEARAAAARLRAGAPAGPLDGVPVAWKDLVDVAGTPTTAASALRRDAPPAAADAPAVARLAAAGLVCVGKTNLSELAFSGLGLNPHSRDAAEPARASGRGCRAAPRRARRSRVAAGVVAVRDRHGHVRLDPRAGRVLRDRRASSRRPRASTAPGVLPLAPSLDSVGPLATTRRRPDRARRRAARRGAATAGAVARRPCRASSWPRASLVDDVEPGVAAAFAAALDALAAAGAHDRAPARSPRSRAGARCCARHGLPRRARGVAVARGAARRARTPRGSTAACCGACATAARSRRRATPRCWTRARALQAAFERRARRRAPVTPASPHVAPQLAPLEADDDVFLAATPRTLRITMPTSFLDMPGVALPIGPAEAGLPASLLRLRPGRQPTTACSPPRSRPRRRSGPR